MYLTLQNFHNGTNHCQESGTDILQICNLFVTEMIAILVFMVVL